MSLRDTDEIIIPSEAIAHIEAAEQRDGGGLAKYEVIELFFEWLQNQPGAYQVAFLRRALHG